MEPSGKGVLYYCTIFMIHFVNEGFIFALLVCLRQVLMMANSADIIHIVWRARLHVIE